LPINASAIGSIVATNGISLLFEKDTIFLLSQDSVFRIMTVALSNAILFLLLWILHRIFHRRAVGLGRTEYAFMLAQLCTAIITFMFLFFAIFNSTSNRVNLYITIALIGLVTINLIAFYLLARLSEQHQLELENTFFRQQQDHYVRSVNDMKQNYEAVQKIRHDFKNTLHVIQVLNERGDREKIKRYIATFLEQNRSSVILVKTDCIYIDVLLSAKISEAAEHNIDVKLITALNLPSDEYIDLCNLLGNMFDNAITACLKVPTGRKILLDIIQKDNEVVICMKNTIVDSVLATNPDLLSEKADQKNHGYGTRIIRDIAKKHHGFADYYEEDNMFCCNVVMYLP